MDAEPLSPPSIMFLTPPLSSYVFPPPLHPPSRFSQLGVSSFSSRDLDPMSSAISSPPTASSSLGQPFGSTTSMAMLAAAAAVGTGSEPSSGSEGGQQLITKHLAPVKRGGRTKKPSTKAQEALA